MCLYLCLLTVIENEELCQCVFVFWLFYNAHMHNVNVDTCVEREATVSFKSLSFCLSVGDDRIRSPHRMEPMSTEHMELKILLKIGQLIREMST